MHKSDGFFAELKRRNVIRVAALYVAGAWLAVEVAGTLLPMFAVPGWVARGLVILLAIGFLPALVFAWVFELTPQGIKREVEVPAAASITRHTARHIDRAVVGLLVLLIGYVAIDKLLLTPRRDAALVAASSRDVTAAAAHTAGVVEVAGKSIAVLPFRNDGGKDDELYFSDGLSEDLITALSNFEGLKVIARDSAFQFRDSKESSKAIAAQLGVANLLSGSVRRLGDVVRISATLVNASDGSSLWSQRYDRPYRDLFALQDDITAAVSEALQARLLEEPDAAQQSERPRSGNLEAYEAVLRGNFNAAKSTEEGTQAAIDDYGQAIALDPVYAYAYARRADSRIVLMANFDKVTIDGSAAARQDIATALRLAPQSVEAFIAQSRLLALSDSDQEGALRASQHAVQLAPRNVSALKELYGMQASLGQIAPAIAGLKRAVALNPLSAPTRYVLALVLGADGQHAAAESELRTVIRQQPESATFHAILAEALLLQGRSSEAVEAAKQEPDAYWRTYALAQAYWGDGDRDRSDDALQSLIREHADDGSSQIAAIYAQRGQPDEMFRWLARAKTKNADGVFNDAGVTEMRYRFFLTRYRDDPRYIALARELGLMREDENPARAGT